MSHTAPSRTWELARQELETYSLMFPHVSFKMEDTSRSGDSSRYNDHMIRIPKVRVSLLSMLALIMCSIVQNSSILGTFKHLYGSALTEVNHLGFL